MVVNKWLNRLSAFILTLLMVCILWVIVAQVTPWYHIYNPDKIEVYQKKSCYYQGERVQFKFERNSLITTRAKVTRELIRVDPDGTEYEIFKVRQDSEIGRGHKSIVVTYKIPDCKDFPNFVMNGYRWQGVTQYKPFGMLERTERWTTEIFHVCPALK